MATLATLTNSGRAAIAAAIAARRIHLGWGAGEAAWDALEDGDLPSLVKRTELYDEIGRRTVEIFGFVEPDENGEIEVPVGLLPDGAVETARYARRSEETPYLYFRVNFDFADAATATIRELGIFMDTETLDTLPPGLRYFTPDQLVSPGKFLAMQIVRPSILRSPSIRQSIEFVLPI